MAIRVTTNDIAERVAEPQSTRPRVGGMIRAAVAGSASVVLIAALSACGGGSSSGSASSSSAGATAGASVAATSDGIKTAPAARSGSVPSPDAGQRTQLVYILKAIDPGVSTDDDALVRKSVEVCGRMLKGEGGAALDKDIQKEFGNGSYLPQGEQLQAFALTLTNTFCR
jgi:hypothetical protein